ncbi:FAD-binding oxidoreductase [Streptomyces sp. NPDC088752]|uniref:FAD-binding oxidoreductase n=1 Tax=Streptomyces sp. NPDC088752 TaxID=3154963 RepID=UPI003434B27E
MQNHRLIPSVIDRLRSVIEVDRVLAAGPTGDRDRGRRLWNGAVPHQPAVIVRPRMVAEVQKIVLIAREAEMPLSVLGGGHDWVGRSVRHGGLVIDMSSMRHVGIDTWDQVATLQGGATAGDVIKAGAPFDLVAATGTVHAVGMVGLTLGGGYGPLNGRAGLALDNLISADVVLADGRLVTADAEREPDLFWALRGGGGNFGVVVSMRLRLHRIPSVLAGFITYPLNAGGVWERLGEVLAEAPDKLTVPCGVMNGEDGHPLLYLAPTWSGDPLQGERAVEPLLRLAGRGQAQTKEMSYRQVLAQNDAWAATGRHYEIATRNVPGFTPETAAVLREAGATMTSPLTAIPMHHFHGAASRVPAEATAFGMRHDHFLIEVVAVWESADANAVRHRAWVASVSKALAPHSLPGGYPNLLATDAAEQIAHAYGTNAPRLLAVKHRYDPEGVFSSTPLPIAS